MDRPCFLLLTEFLAMLLFLPMKYTTLSKRFFLGFASVAFVIAQPAMAEGEEKESPLHESMEQSGRALKSLRKIDKADWAAGAKAVREAADGIRKGMEYVPELIKEMPEGKEKVIALADYKRLMGLSYAALSELEIAYLSEDQAKVDAAMEKVKGIKKEGHKKYEDD